MTLNTFFFGEYIMKNITAEIISTGEEIMQGLYADTNASEISQRLKELGISTLYHSSAGDNFETLKNVLQIARNRVNIVIMTGGLGPTEDDLTRSVVSSVWRKPLKKNQNAENMIRGFFQKKRIPMAETNIVQALIPEDASLLPNNVGTAPGFILHENETDSALIALPGPSREWIPMFDADVEPFLKKHFATGKVCKTHVIRTAGVPESLLNEYLKPLFHSEKQIYLGFLAKQGKVDIRITANGSDVEKTLNRISRARKRILKLIPKKNIYSEDQDKNIEQAVAEILKNSGSTIALAESCTGGLISKRLTDIPGSSSYLLEGIIVYSNHAKVKYLGVREATLEKNGAVAGETVAEMAEGIYSNSDADIGLSVTGVAGPGGGSPEKPVGLVYFGMARRNSISSTRRIFPGDRQNVRELAADFALEWVRRSLEAYS